MRCRETEVEGRGEIKFGNRIAINKTRAVVAEGNLSNGSEEQYDELKPLASNSVYMVAETKRAKENK